MTTSNDETVSKQLINLKIEAVASDHPLPLYTDYAGQESIAYILLDTRTGEVWLHERAPHENGVSADEFNGHVRSYQIPNNLTGDGLSKLLGDSDLMSMLFEVCAGATEKWNGNNYVSRLDDSAKDADDRARWFCGELVPESYGCLQPWDAHQYFQSSQYRDLVQEGEDHEDAAERLRVDALKEGVHMTQRNILTALEEKRRDNEE